MFREMRRNRQALSAGDASALLEAGTSGVLAVAGDDGYPYAVPLSYACDREGERIWFHCARSGHKLDAVRRCEKASFCVIVQDQIVPEEYTTHFRSVIAFGTVRIIQDGAALRAAAEQLGQKYRSLLKAFSHLVESRYHLFIDHRKRRFFLLSSHGPHGVPPP